MPAYVAALLAEFKELGFWYEGRAATLYLGGGTPSLLPPAMVAQVIQAAGLRPGAEVSMEANPGTVDGDSLAGLRQAGVNRLSLGMQSADDAELSLLGRLHDAQAVNQAVLAARAAGIDNLSLDLIFGLPQQGLAAWSDSLDAALALAPEHLSLYALTVEAGTLLAAQIDAGDLATPDADLAADMYEMASERLAAAGYRHYEISNWALPGRECLHNLFYWRNDAYLGFGAGAWGHWPDGDSSWRLHNVDHPRPYISRLRSGPAVERRVLPVSSATEEQEHVARPMAMAETMFMGLRLIHEGVSRWAFRERFGLDPLEVFQGVVHKLADEGSLAWDADRLWLPRSAILTSNQVLVNFLPDGP